MQIEFKKIKRRTMAKLLFKLGGVPEDEAEEIRQALEENEIDYYETSPGLLGLSFAGIWIKQEEQFDTAQTILDNYQKQRQQSAIERRQENPASVSLWQAFLASPIRMTLVVLFVVAVLYLAISPFFPMSVY